MITQSEDQSPEDNDDEDEFVLEETTSNDDIESFEKWAKDQAKGDLRKHKEMISVAKLDSLRDMIIKLNHQQRLIFDDFCERMMFDDSYPIYLYIAGET